MDNSTYILTSDGEMSKEAKTKAIKSAQAEMKKSLSKTKERFANTKTKEERTRLAQELYKKTTAEVPNAYIKRGSHTVNALLGVVGAGTTAVGAGALIAINPAFAGAAVASAAVGIAAEAGAHYIVQLGLDKLS